MYPYLIRYFKFGLRTNQRFYPNLWVRLPCRSHRQAINNPSDVEGLKSAATSRSLEARSEDVFRKLYSGSSFFGSRVPDGYRPTVNEDGGGEKVQPQETGQNFHRENLNNYCIMLGESTMDENDYGRKR